MDSRRVKGTVGMSRFHKLLGAALSRCMQCTFKWSKDWEDLGMFCNALLQGSGHKEPVVNTAAALLDNLGKMLTLMDRHGLAEEAKLLGFQVSKLETSKVAERPDALLTPIPIRGDWQSIYLMLMWNGDILDVEPQTLEDPRLISDNYQLCGALLKQLETWCVVMAMQNCKRAHAELFTDFIAELKDKTSVRHLVSNMTSPQKSVVNDKASSQRFAIVCGMISMKYGKDVPLSRPRVVEAEKALGKWMAASKGGKNFEDLLQSYVRAPMTSTTSLVKEAPKLGMFTKRLAHDIPADGPYVSLLHSLGPEAREFLEEMEAKAEADAKVAASASTLANECEEGGDDLDLLGGFLNEDYLDACALVRSGSVSMDEGGALSAGSNVSFVLPCSQGPCDLPKMESGASLGDGDRNTPTGAGGGDKSHRPLGLSTAGSAAAGNVHNPARPSGIGPGGLAAAGLAHAPDALDGDRSLSRSRSKLLIADVIPPSFEPGGGAFDMSTNDNKNELREAVSRRTLLRSLSRVSTREDSEDDLSPHLNSASSLAAESSTDRLCYSSASSPCGVSSPVPPEDRSAALRGSSSPIQITSAPSPMRGRRRRSVVVVIDEHESRDPSSLLCFSSQPSSFAPRRSNSSTLPAVHSRPGSPSSPVQDLGLRVAIPTLRAALSVSMPASYSPLSRSGAASPSGYVKLSYVKLLHCAKENAFTSPSSCDRVVRERISSPSLPNRLVSEDRYGSLSPNPLRQYPKQESNLAPSAPCRLAVEVSYSSRHDSGALSPTPPGKPAGEASHSHKQENKPSRLALELQHSSMQESGGVSPTPVSRIPLEASNCRKQENIHSPTPPARLASEMSISPKMSASRRLNALAAERSQETIANGAATVLSTEGGFDHFLRSGLKTGRPLRLASVNHRQGL
eukprot:gene6534-3177_t